MYSLPGLTRQWEFLDTLKYLFSTLFLNFVHIMIVLKVISKTWIWKLMTYKMNKDNLPSTVSLNDTSHSISLKHYSFPTLCSVKGLQIVYVCSCFPLNSKGPWLLSFLVTSVHIYYLLICFQHCVSSKVPHIQLRKLKVINGSKLGWNKNKSS